MPFAAANINIVSSYFFLSSTGFDRRSSRREVKLADLILYIFHDSSFLIPKRSLE